MPVQPVTIRKRFIALRNCQIGTGFGFLTLIQGQTYETSFKSVDNYNSLVGMKMIVENRDNKIKTDVEKAAAAEQVKLNSPLPKIESETPAIKDLVSRISKVKTTKALNNIIAKLTPSELNSAPVQTAIVSIQTALQYREKETVNG